MSLLLQAVKINIVWCASVYHHQFPITEELISNSIKPTELNCTSSNRRSFTRTFSDRFSATHKRKKKLIGRRARGTESKLFFHYCLRSVHSLSESSQTKGASFWYLTLARRHGSAAEERKKDDDELFQKEKSAAKFHTFESSKKLHNLPNHWRGKNYLNMLLELDRKCLRHLELIRWPMFEYILVGCF